MKLNHKIIIFLSCLLLSAGYIYIWLNPIIVDNSEIEYPSFNTVVNQTTKNYENNNK